MRIFTFGLSQSPSVPNPQSACVSSISYWFQAEQVREVFMEAACGGKPTWFLFMETFWKAKRGSLETFGLVSTEVWARGRPSEQLWKILGKRLVTVCVCAEVSHRDPFIHSSCIHPAGLSLPVFLLLHLHSLIASQIEQKVFLIAPNQVSILQASQWEQLLCCNINPCCLCKCTPFRKVLKNMTLFSLPIIVSIIMLVHILAEFWWMTFG